MYIQPRSGENVLLNTRWSAKIAFWSDSIDWFDVCPTDDLNLGLVDPKQRLVRLMKSSACKVQKIKGVKKEKREKLYAG